jgi:dTDP-4-amino-4,6-dideoxy-D-galactose acyltransferase
LTGETDAELIYLFSTVRQPNLESAGIALADEKATFAKQLDAAAAGREEIAAVVSYSGPVTDELLELAIRSGSYSRFRRDERLAGKFEELYRFWITKSVNRMLADEVFVIRDAEQIVGMVTLKIENAVGIIGLIAVDLAHQGQRIGRKLLAKADQWYVARYLTRAVVVTQLANQTACRFYENNGYHLDSVTYVYHAWMA